MTDTAPLSLSRRILIYMPAYNCASVIVSVLNDIPKPYWDLADVLVVDNCSADGTADAVVKAIDEGELPATVQVIQPPHNVGYAGSQKLAFKLALQAPAVEWVIMLHGDGQYPPALLDEVAPHFDEPWDVVQGYRSKKAFGTKEETPRSTYAVIKTLDAIESGILGFPIYEWHSGFVMYATSFLRQIDLDRLTKSRHIDGHLLFAAHSIGAKIKRLPIWKRYRKFPGFVGWERIDYVLNVLRLTLRFRLQKWLGRARKSVVLEGRKNSPPAYSVCRQTVAGD